MAAFTNQSANKCQKLPVATVAKMAKFDLALRLRLVFFATLQLGGDLAEEFMNADAVVCLRFSS